ncbi:hypothetical protein BBJ28_00001185 [Nothophytophthora sp. Chile5]|nr:hypothetical protein BBJ28_00001185 [Nothophytophthora sp. Chile5]
MCSKEPTVDKVPRFVRTLYAMLHDEDHCILSWSVDGSHFQVYDVPSLEREVLPKYFKHGKFASFQRQLNNFGFRKWTKTRASVCTFSHEFLHRCHPSQLGALVAEMEKCKAALCAAASHTGTKRPRGGSEDDRSLKRLSVESKQDDEHEPEQELASFYPENLDDVSWPLAGFDATDLCALDWSLVIDSGREDELNALIDPLLTESTPTAAVPLESDDGNQESASECLPPLDLDYLGDAWTDIFDGVIL